MEQERIDTTNEPKSDFLEMVSAIADHLKKEAEEDDEYRGFVLWACDGVKEKPNGRKVFFAQTGRYIRLAELVNSALQEDEIAKTFRRAHSLHDAEDVADRWVPVVETLKEGALKSRRKALTCYRVLLGVDLVWTGFLTFWIAYAHMPAFTVFSNALLVSICIFLLTVRITDTKREIKNII